MNGDGHADVAVNAPNATNQDGFVIVYCGGPQIDSVFDAAVGMDLNSYFGSSLSSVGDVNQDGFGDLIIGAPEYLFFTRQGYWGVFLGDSSIRVTDVQQDQPLPSAITLFQSYPNPFNPATAIRYEVNEGGIVSLEITNLLGERIATLVQEYQGPGSYTATFDGSKHPSGVYFYTLRHQSSNGTTTSTTKKLNLVK
jgi:hypothetical protein